MSAEILSNCQDVAEALAGILLQRGVSRGDIPTGPEVFRAIDEMGMELRWKSIEWGYEPETIYSAPIPNEALGLPAVEDFRRPTVSGGDSGG